MKHARIYYILFITLIVAASCKKDNIMLYEGDTYIQFTKSYTDSSLFSFLSTPDKEEATTSMAVELVGKPENKDKTYKIEVVPELTTAPAANYSIPASF